MAKYALTCVTCGASFEASRRHAQTCSKRCAQRLRRGSVAPANEAYQLTAPPTPDSTERLHSLASLRGPEGPSERTYAIYCDRAAQPVFTTMDRLGRITRGVFSGVRIGDLLRTAAKQGWLAYRHRTDGWYAAEWCSELKTVTLCGPCALPTQNSDATARGADYVSSCGEAFLSPGTPGANATKGFV